MSLWETAHPLTKMPMLLMFSPEYPPIPRYVHQIDTMAERETQAKY